MVLTFILWLTDKWIGKYYDRDEKPPNWLGATYEWAYWKKNAKN